MKEEQFIKLVKIHVAESSLGASTLRKQGGSGLIRTARDFFKELNLADFLTTDEASFISQLNLVTEILRKRFQRGARNWGAARKAINLFLRDSLYNRYLSEYYKLMSIEQWLEVPLDRDVGEGLCKTKIGKELPKWKSIKALTPEQNFEYQEAARQFGDQRDTSRVHIDLFFWRQRKKQ